MSISGLVLQDYVLEGGLEDGQVEVLPHHGVDVVVLVHLVAAVCVGHFKEVLVDLDKGI